MSIPFDRKDNELYRETLAWLNKNMTSTFQKDAVTKTTTALAAIAKQLAELPPPKAITAHLVYLRTLRENCNCEQIPWHNFQIFIYEKLQQREATYEKLKSDLKTHDWETITKALNDFTPTKG